MPLPAKVIQRLRASKEKSAHELGLAAGLRSAGWTSYPRGWCHPHLDFPWSLEAASRLQDQADAGDQEPVLAYLRGDCWPL